MDVDDDDDFYAPEEPEAPATEPAAPSAPAASKPDAQNEDLEEGEEEDEGGEMDEDDDEDSDVVIVTESKDAPPSLSRYSEIRNIPQRSTTSDATIPSAPVKTEDSRPLDPQPASTSKIDVNAVPIHKGTGKPITQVNIDEDLAEHDKPWRKPGTDLSDYFNYGFDEFTWALYAQKQEALRGEYNQDAVAQNSKKLMEEMQAMMMMNGMGAGAGAGGVAALPGMDGMTPEAMMQQLMASNIDPSQMDPAALFAAMANGAGAGGNQGQGAQGQSFGNGFGGNQGQGYGYEQQQVGGNRGNFGGRGRGRRNWQ